jgi:hypothetical protein
MSGVVAWSHSVLDSFETCAWRHYQTKVIKAVVEPQSKEMAWGNAVHKGLELRVKNDAPLPENMSQWEPVALSAINARKAGAVVETEQKMSIDKNYRPCSYFAKDANKNNLVWVRGAADLAVIKKNKAVIFDYKTGKVKENSDQMKLMAAMTFAHKPYLETVTTAFVWLKSMSPPTIEHFTKDEVPDIWQGFLPRVQRLEIALAENKWPKRPSGLCREWCPVPRQLCEYRG